MAIIYYLFEDKIPTQDELELEGYNDVEEYIQNTLGDEEILNEIHGAYYCEINISPNEFVGNDNLVIPKIKNDLNVDSTIDAKLFEEDTSYKHDDYIKITSNKYILTNYVKFVINLNQDFLNIQKQQVENQHEDLPHVNQINNAYELKHNDFTDTRLRYVDPLYQRCAIAIVNIEEETVTCYNLIDFINLCINQINFNHTPTYYVHTKLCAHYDL